jgi:hypothetical protein
MEASITSSVNTGGLCYVSGLIMKLDVGRCLIRTEASKVNDLLQIEFPAFLTSAVDRVLFVAASVIKYSRAPVSTDSVSAGYLGPNKLNK